MLLFLAGFLAEVFLAAIAEPHCQGPSLSVVEHLSAVIPEVRLSGGSATAVGSGGRA
jgi:hypothetical protein